jgi:hypothetical protein
MRKRDWIRKELKGCFGVESDIPALRVTRTPPFFDLRFIFASGFGNHFAALRGDENYTSLGLRCILARGCPISSANPLPQSANPLIYLKLTKF